MESGAQNLPFGREAKEYLCMCGLQLYLENFYPYIAKKFIGPHRRGWWRKS